MHRLRPLTLVSPTSIEQALQEAHIATAFPGSHGDPHLARSTLPTKDGSAIPSQTSTSPSVGVLFILFSFLFILLFILLPILFSSSRGCPFCRFSCLLLPCAERVTVPWGRCQAKAVRSEARDARERRGPSIVFRDRLAKVKTTNKWVSRFVSRFVLFCPFVARN